MRIPYSLAGCFPARPLLPYSCSVLHWTFGSWMSRQSTQKLGSENWCSELRSRCWRVRSYREAEPRNTNPWQRVGTRERGVLYRAWTWWGKVKASFQCWGKAVYLLWEWVPAKVPIEYWGGWVFEVAYIMIYIHQGNLTVTLHTISVLSKLK